MILLKCHLTALVTVLIIILFIGDGSSYQSMIYMPHISVHSRNQMFYLHCSVRESKCKSNLFLERVDIFSVWS